MFKDRNEAGKLLSEKLDKFRNRSDTLILGLPRGGVVVAGEVARKLNLPLQVLSVKKLGAPYNSELAIGAVAPGGVKWLDYDMIKVLGVDEDYLDEEIKRKGQEAEEKNRKFQSVKSEYRNINFKNIILIDDGVATGATVRAAIKYIREKMKKVKIILAVPVIAKEVFSSLKSEVDSVTTLEVPEYFGAVGQFYQEFGQVEDSQVLEILGIR